MPDSGMAYWTKSFLRKNYWRVSAYLDYEDFVQEAGRVYTKCYWRYNHLPAKVLMGVYMRALANHVHDLSRTAGNYKRLFVKECELGLSEEGEATPMERLQEAEAVGDLSEILIVIAEAPTPQVRTVLSEFMVTDRVAKNETTVEFLCRICGVDADAAKLLIRQCRDYLYGSMTTA